MRYEKKSIVFIIIAACLFFLFSGCCTTNTKSDVADTIERNSYTVGQLEATVAALDGTVTSSRERIENIIGTSRSIGNGIDRITYLFEQYESEVDRLLYEIDEIRRKIEVQSKTVDDCGGIYVDVRINPGGSSDSENQVWNKDSIPSKPAALEDFQSVN